MWEPKEKQIFIKLVFLGFIMKYIIKLSLKFLREEAYTKLEMQRFSILSTSYVIGS